MRQLEQRFGVKLIERVGRRATPTAAGTELLAHARGIEAALVAAAADAMVPHAGGHRRPRADRDGRDRLHLSAAADAARVCAGAFPSLEIVVSTGNTPEIVRAVEENRIDVALVTLPVAGRMFDVRPVLDDEFVVIGTKGMQLPREITAAELARAAADALRAGRERRAA